eukprot:gene43480-48986_t
MPCVHPLVGVSTGAAAASLRRFVALADQLPLPRAQGAELAAAQRADNDGNDGNDVKEEGAPPGAAVADVGCGNGHL